MKQRTCKNNNKKKFNDNLKAQKKHKQAKEKR